METCYVIQKEIESDWFNYGSESGDREEAICYLSSLRQLYPEKNFRIVQKTISHQILTGHVQFYSGLELRDYRLSIIQE